MFMDSCTLGSWITGCWGSFLCSATISSCPPCTQIWNLLVILATVVFQCFSQVLSVSLCTQPNCCCDNDSRGLPKDGIPKKHFFHQQLWKHCIASSPSLKQTRTKRNVTGDDRKYVFYGHIWYFDINAITIIVNPGISCCRVKRTSAFWKCHETLGTSYQLLVPGLWYSGPFRRYATHLGRFGGRHCDKTFGHVHFDHSDLGRLGISWCWALQ